MSTPKKTKAPREKTPVHRQEKDESPVKRRRTLDGVSPAPGLAPGPSGFTVAAKNVFLPGVSEPKACLIRIQDGKFHTVMPLGDPELLKAWKPTSDADVRVPDGCVVLPGVVDSHVHVNEPGREEWEGFWTATRSAARGGVTCIGDMPLNSSPVTTSVDALSVKKAAASGKTFVDTRFIGGVVGGENPDGNTKDLLPLVDAGVAGFKCFLIHSGIDEFPHVSDEQARKALAELKKADKPTFLMFHAELELAAKESSGDSSSSPSIASSSVQKSGDEEEKQPLNPLKYETFLLSRPDDMESKAMQMVVDLCKESGVRCHIVHLSSAEALPIVKAARQQALPLSVETCFHYLFFDAESIPDAQPRFKCCPPIRSADNADKLWAALLEGTIDIIVSDHSPCTPALKEVDGGNFMNAWGGISSLQFGLQIVHTVARKRGLPENEIFARIVKWMSEGPATLLGIENQKGKIAPGFDADLAIFNKNVWSTVRDTDLEFKNKVSAYVGSKLRGRVVKTILRGQVVYESKRAGKAGVFTPTFSESPMGKLI